MATGDRYRDRDNDVWTGQSDGSWLLTESENSVVVGSHGPSLSYLRGEYGPLEELDPSPADLSAPATRGDIVRVLEAVRALITQEVDTVAGLIDEIKEGGQ